MTHKEPKIWIITGPFQVGKTHFCDNLIKQAQERGLKIAGVICPPVFEEQIKTAITIENLSTHEKRMLAVKRTSETGGLLTEHWAFNEEVMKWGNSILAETSGCDLLLVDELGPLEFTRGEGWQNGLKAIDMAKYKAAIVVIRPALRETALKRWPKAIVVEFQSRLRMEEINQIAEEIFMNI